MEMPLQLKRLDKVTEMTGDRKTYAQRGMRGERKIFTQSG